MSPLETICICVKVVNFRNKIKVQFFLFEQTLMNAWMVHTTVTEMRIAQTQKEVLFAHASQVSQATEKLVWVRSQHD